MYLYVYCSDMTLIADYLRDENIQGALCHSVDCGVIDGKILY